MSELIYHETLLFLWNRLLSKKHFNSFFLQSLKCSELFLKSLPPGLNCGNDESLSPKYEISEPGYKEKSGSINFFPGHFVMPKKYEVLFINSINTRYKSSFPEVFCEKVVLQNFTQFLLCILFLV